MLFIFSHKTWRNTEPDQLFTFGAADIKSLYLLIPILNESLPLTEQHLFKEWINLQQHF